MLSKLKITQTLHHVNVSICTLWKITKTWDKLIQFNLSRNVIWLFAHVWRSTDSLMFLIKKVAPSKVCPFTRCLLFLLNCYNVLFLDSLNKIKLYKCQVFNKFKISAYKPQIIFCSLLFFLTRETESKQIATVFPASFDDVRQGI